MAAVPEPHQNWKQQLLNGEIDPESLASLRTSLDRFIAKSFRLRQELAPIFQNKQFFKTLRLQPYYEYSATIIQEVAPFLEELIAWQR